jgi:hypothetical protein
MGKSGAERLMMGVFFVTGDIEKNGKSIVFREIRGHPERRSARTNRVAPIPSS